MNTSTLFLLGMSNGTAAMIVVALMLLGLITIVVMMYGKLWLQAFLSNAHIGFGSLVGMTFRRVNPRVIVDNKVVALKAGVKGVDEDLLEAHYLANGNVYNVINALVSAAKADIALTFKQAAAIDLAGRDVLEAVRTSVLPKVIMVPQPSSGKQTIDAIAKDGIQLRAKALVTVRTNIDQLIGGATEETIIARVGEGVVTTIGSAATHKDVLENPDSISKMVLSKGLDSGTAFEILSIDIADIDVGDNIGARLQADQAEADKRVAQAKAEERRAMAVAAEQEFQAAVQENRAKVVLAEAEIPMAISQAFREGNLGIMDYYRYRNLQADTDMRNNIADSSSDE